MFSITILSAEFPLLHAESVHLLSENRSPLALIRQTLRRSPPFLFKPHHPPLSIWFPFFSSFPLVAFPLGASRKAQNESVAVQRGAWRSEERGASSAHYLRSSPNERSICDLRHLHGGHQNFSHPFNWPVSDLYAPDGGRAGCGRGHIATQGESQIIQRQLEWRSDGFVGGLIGGTVFTARRTRRARSSAMRAKRCKKFSLINLI